MKQNTYYPINEEAAARAKAMNSFYDYVPGSATTAYRQAVDEAVAIAERQKEEVGEEYHAKIDNLLDTYARKLAKCMNDSFSIDARVPSIMIAGGGNFPVRKKEAQNIARQKNWSEREEIQGLLDKIRSVGKGGISADDPHSIEKLKEKLAILEKFQEKMKAVNAYYRRHQTLDGCTLLPKKQLLEIQDYMRRYASNCPKPFASFELSNNNAAIRRVKGRIKTLEHRKEKAYAGWEFDGGKAEPNTTANRLQIFFNEKPDGMIRSVLKKNGFRWAPSANAWQRQLNNNAYFAADYVEAIYPLSGGRPSDLLIR